MIARSVAAGVAAASLLVATGGASARDALVRPGVSVGKIRLGMTEAQLRAAMGKPSYVRQKPAGFGRVRIEYQFGPLAEWTVELAGTRGNMRVVSVLTYLKSERLPNGLGVGTRERKVLSTYGRRLQCEVWPTYKGIYGHIYLGSPNTLDPATRTCSLRGPAGASTIFVSHVPNEQLAKYIPRAVVREVGVRVTTR